MTVNGNVNPSAEANIFGDPDAANVVFSRLSNCLVLGLDVTHQCILSKETIDEMKGKGKYGTFLHDITQFYLNYHRQVSAGCCCLSSIIGEIDVVDMISFEKSVIRQFFSRYLCRSMYNMEGIFLHDAAAFTAVVRPEMFEWHDGKVVVVADGPAKGHTIMDKRRLKM